VGVQQARPSHLDALMDRQPVGVAAPGVQQQRGQGAGGAAGGRVLRDAGQRREHAGADRSAVMAVGQQAEPALPRRRRRHCPAEGAGVRGDRAQCIRRDLGDGEP